MAVLLSALVLSTTAVAQAAEPAEGRALASSGPSTDWVVSATDAAQLITAGEVTVLDARTLRAYGRGHVPGAVHVDWTRFSQTADPHRGKLLPEGELGAALRAVGLRAQSRVLVIGDPPHDWGEDGRVVWMLRAAGHTRSALVDGGHAALERAGVRMTRDVAKPVAGDFEVRWVTGLIAVRDDLLGSAVAPLLIDTREPREYRGATPYGEARGGHPPGARSLYFKRLLAPDGTLKSRAEIRRIVEEVAGGDVGPIVAYCTGGVRSGWLVVVLRHAGFGDTRNYAGSMWDWAAAPAASYPLVRD